MQVVHRTCQDKSGESKGRIAEQRDDACEHNVSSERLDTLHCHRLWSTDRRNLHVDNIPTISND